MKNILGAVATCTNGKKDVNALVFDRRDMRTDGIIARAVDIPAVSVQPEPSGQNLTN